MTNFPPQFNAQRPRTGMTPSQIVGVGCAGCLGVGVLLVLFTGCVSMLSEGSGGGAPSAVATVTVTERVTEEAETLATETVAATEEVEVEVEVTVTETETVTAEPETTGGGSGTGGGSDGGGASTYYDNCTAARAAGAAPVREGDPGYGAHLDRDGDGVGCE
ncbi:excalibur calcium-binding domain-containing protein [Nocardiopsis sp. Huas11]|uniref:excalibur calcium-binding domain-containing protein n=1 Tax=Nocardiopsis sp. Huas11 TaxID=2183912 RepID=UPI000F2AC925|nr:excalibur calcium-binding domain-containing protein [Nocardiopsis sp. Huas11]RKS06763.1 excalibur calcium-binding domain-containing protein [Nocardiopsis sp. Huas11]